LAIELQGLIDLGFFDLETTGFTLGEIEVAVGEAAEGVRHDASEGSEDDIPRVREPAVSRPGDVWRAGRHLLICCDARERMAYETLLGNERVDLIFTDVPHNMPIDSEVCGSRQVRHQEFAMGVGKMTSTEFTIFWSGPSVPRLNDAGRGQSPSYAWTGGMLKSFWLQAKPSSLS
jgi:hypothetical protein